MFCSLRPFVCLASGALALALGGCAQSPWSQPGYPGTSTYPGTGVSSVPSTLEYGQVLAIEYVPAGTGAARSPNVAGAVVGGVAGAVLGHQIGGGSGRDAATVLGGVAGAAAGSQVGRGSVAPSTGPSYRVMVRTDQGVQRSFEVPSPGDLRVGDRVRVENNVIYRM